MRSVWASFVGARRHMNKHVYRYAELRLRGWAGFLGSLEDIPREEAIPGRRGLRPLDCGYHGGRQGGEGGDLKAGVTESLPSLLNGVRPQNCSF